MPREQTDGLSWGSYSCETHGYAGIPKCPVPDCPNGTPRQLYRTMKVWRDKPTEERVFMRDKLHHDNAFTYRWLEIAPIPDAPIYAAAAQDKPIA